MVETWLWNPNSPFHNLIENTIDNSFCDTEEKALKYLQLVNQLGLLYSGMSSYDLFDYEKLIYIELNFSHNEQISLLLKDIKERINLSYKYKHKYLKRITNPIPRERFDNHYDDYLVKSFNLVPKKYYDQQKEVTEKQLNKENVNE